MSHVGTATRLVANNLLILNSVFFVEFKLRNARAYFKHQKVLDALCSIHKTCTGQKEIL